MLAQAKIDDIIWEELVEDSDEFQIITAPAEIHSVPTSTLNSVRKSKKVTKMRTANSQKKPSKLRKDIVSTAPHNSSRKTPVPKVALKMKSLDEVIRSNSSDHFKNKHTPMTNKRYDKSLLIEPNLKMFPCMKNMGPTSR